MSQVISNLPKLWQRTRKRWWWAALLAVYVTPFFVFSGFGAFDAYLKIAGIPGEADDQSKHKDWIAIDSFSFGMSRAATAPGQTSQVKLDAVAVRKRIDKASPLLMLKCCTGEHIPEATLEYTKPIPTGQDVVYLQIKMSDLLVTGYSLSGDHGSGGGTLPVDSLSLNFTKIEMTYIPYDDAGNPLQPVTAQCDFTQSGAN